MILILTAATLFLVRIIIIANTSCDPPCINGECSDDNSTCICSPGFTGEVCDVAIITECAVNPCENGGNCSMVATIPVCECPEGFKGQICEISSMYYFMQFAFLVELLNSYSDDFPYSTADKG